MRNWARPRQSLCSVQILALAIALVVGLGLALLSVARYRAYNAAMGDLGNMTQAIWSATQGRALEYTHESGGSPQFSRLGWHAEIVYFLIAPLYSVLPSPITLLVLQAVLFAYAAIPLFNVACLRLGSEWAALGVVLVYLFYPVAQTAVLFDFHGDTLAMPLLVLALCALERKAWRRYWVFVALSLSCKIYVAAPVVAMGLALWLTGQRKVGRLTSVVGLAWAAVLLLLVRPEFSPAQGLAESTGLLEYFQFYFGALFVNLSTTAWPRLVVAAIVLLPVLPFVASAPVWLLPALAVAVPALLSNGPGPSYHHSYHHYALTVPFFVAAVLTGTGMVKDQGKRIALGSGKLLAWPLLLGVSVILALALSSAFVDGPVNPSLWLGEDALLSDEMKYRRTSRDILKDEWLDENVPDGVALSASPLLAPHLAHRQTVFTTQNIAGNLSYVEYAVYDAYFDHVVDLGGGEFLGGALYDVPALQTLLEDSRFGVIAQRDGLVLLARNPEPDSTQYQGAQLVELGTESSDHIAHFGDMIALLDAEASVVAEDRVRLQFDWLAISSSLAERHLFAVSRAECLAEDRIAHLPTQVMAPTLTWPVSTVVRETFDVEMSTCLQDCVCEVYTTWYDGANEYAYATDARSQVGEEERTLVVRY